MCGIVAYWSKNTEISEEIFQKSINSLNHRGPDFKGYWISSDRKLALGHARLSIIDLKTGNQPLYSKSRNIIIVVNGEFYEYDKIKKHLQEKGYHFQTETDSEILIYLYELYGVDCLKYLRGEFSFILLDKKNNYIFAARDRFGIKPLFYTIYNNTLYISSEIKTLFSFGIPFEWDYQNVNSWENFLPLPGRSLYKNIYSIEPGFFIIANYETIKRKKYWDFYYPKEGEVSSNVNKIEIFRMFRKLLEEAVSIRLHADVPVGCYLSGGLDSSVILALMSKHTESPVDTFTISFDSKLFDESRISYETSRFLGARNHQLRVTDKDLSENFFSAIHHAETFILNNNTVAKFLLSRFTHEFGYKAIMSGEGADEILGGYPNFREDIINYGLNSLSVENQKKLISDLYEKNPAFSSIFSKSDYIIDSLSIENKLGFIPSMFIFGAKLNKKLGSMHTKLFSEAIKNFDPQINFLNQLDEKQILGRDILNKSLYLWGKSILPGLILVNLGDRMEMAHSVEGRVPFLDHKVVEFLVKIPSFLKINDLTEKYILRESFKNLITPTIYNRQKHPFKAPHPTLTINPFSQLMLEVFNSDLLKNNIIYDQTVVLKQFKIVQDMPMNEREQWDIAFMIILSSCALQNIFTHPGPLTIR